LVVGGLTRRPTCRRPRRVQHVLANYDSTTVLRVGITGHRNLHPDQDHDVRRAVRGAIESLSQRCLPARIEIMTAMADGADQLLADVAIDLGCALHIVLPKPRDVYRAELSDDGARRLDELNPADNIRISTLADGRREGTHDPDPATPYHHLGLYLARSAHVLIALWDGGSERKPGGTLDVLSRYLDRSYDPDPNTGLPNSIDADDGSVEMPGPTAIWIDSARSDGVPPKATKTTYVAASGLPGTWRTSDQMPASLCRMLDDLSAVAAVSNSVRASRQNYPLLDQIPTDIDPSRRIALQETHDAYSAADELALIHQSRSDSSFLWASLIAAAMGFAFLWFAKINDHIAWLYGYLALFLVGYALFRAAQSRRWLRHHLSLRVLAETLRVRFFTTLLGVAEQVDVRRLLALTGVSSFPGFGWAVEADRIGVPTTQQLPTELAAQSELVRAAWVDDQARYFERKVERLHARHGRLEQIQRVLYVLSFATAIAIVVFGSELKTVYAPGHVSSKTILVFLMGLLPLWLTLWELHQGRMATRELLWQFRNQASLFRRASVELSNPNTDEAKQQIYIELAERSLFETYLWTIHRFHREFTPPSGG
jgi:hypothetical protein